MTKYQAKLKRTFAGIAILIILLFIAVQLVPSIYKNKLIEVTKDYASSTLNSQLEFGDIKVGIFSSFPDLSVHISDVSITDSSKQHVVKSIDIPEVALSFKLWNVVSKKPNEWDIKQVRLEGGTLKYMNRENNSYALVENIAYLQKGEFTGNNLVLKPQLESADLTLNIDGYRYLTKAQINARSTINYSKDSNKVSIVESRVRLNKAELELQGWLTQFSSDTMEMHLSFNNSNKELEGLLSLLPIGQTNKFKFESAGAYTLVGEVSGTLNDRIYPVVKSHLSIDSGLVKFENCEKSIQDINGKLLLTKPEGTLDSAIVELQYLNLKLNESPVGASAIIKHLTSEAQVDLNVKGNINASDLEYTLPIAIPIAGGKLQTDLKIDGKFADFTQKRFENLAIEGILNAKNLLVDLPKQAVYKVTEAKLRLKQNQTLVDQLNVEFNQSDLALNGKLHNLLPYLIKDQEVLSGDLNLYSEHLNNDDFTTRTKVHKATIKAPKVSKQSGPKKAPVKKEEKPKKDIAKRVSPKEKAKAVSEKTSTAKQASKPNTSLKPQVAKPEQAIAKGCFVVPANLNLKVLVDIKHFEYDKVPAENLKGNIVLKSGKAEVKNFTSTFAQGEINLEGNYYAPDSSKAQTSFHVKAADMDIQTLYKMKHFMPEWKAFLKDASGNLSTELDLSAPFNANGKMVTKAIEAKGEIYSKKIPVKDSDFFNQLASLSKVKALQDPTLKDVDIKYVIEGGKADLEKGAFKINLSSFKLFGLIYLNQQLDLVAKANISSEEFPSSATKAISGFLSSAGINLALPKNVKLSVGIYGDLNKPSISLGQSQPKAYLKQN